MKRGNRGRRRSRYGVGVIGVEGKRSSRKWMWYEASKSNMSLRERGRSVVGSYREWSGVWVMASEE